VSGKGDNDGGSRATHKPVAGSGKSSPYNPNRSNGNIDWASVEGDAIIDAIDAITRNGDAVLFSRSMDGGVLVATVCSGSERIKFYAKDAAEMTVHLQVIKRELDIRSGR
jgi:hypothetical protein